MFTADAIHWAGSQQALASRLKRVRQSVWRWGEVVPEEYAYKLYYLSAEEIPLHDEHYADPDPAG